VIEEEEGLNIWLTNYLWCTQGRLILARILKLEIREYYLYLRYTN